MKSLEERFWPKVNKGPGCWEWNATRSDSGKGYGEFCVNYKLEGAHRISWILTNGPIPGNLRVLHRCDNKGCVRPDHLFLGTQSENKIDEVQKGRSYNAKLTNAQVLQIRSSRQSSTVLGKWFGVHPAHIRKIKRGTVKAYVR